MERVTNFELPATHGTYALHIVLTRPQLLIIGRLGRQRFPDGHYFYVGSARGPGGLRSRTGRHVRGDGQPHWHIDYLRAFAEVRAVLYTVTDTLLECAWSQALAQLPQAFIPVAHFGASDCRSGCAAHLIGFPQRIDSKHVLRALAPVTSTPIVSLRPC
jgi:Uri superfamily endonuclease